jgi:hypothetical protein
MFYISIINSHDNTLIVQRFTGVSQRKLDFTKDLALLETIMTHV